MLVFIGSAPEEGAEETNVSYIYMIQCISNRHIYLPLWPELKASEECKQTRAAMEKPGQWTIDLAFAYFIYKAITW